MYLPTKIKKQLVRFAYNFCLSKDKKFKRKKALAMIDKKYLHRYLYVLDTVDKKIPQEAKENIIWTCWLQGEENAPDVVKACLKQMRKVENKQKIIVVTAENFAQYTTIPDYIITKWKAKKISNTHFSDILRVCLLYENSGTWLDSTTYLMDCLPQEIKTAEFFSYHSRTFLRKYPKVIGNNNWLISCKKHHPLIAGMRAFLFEYWQKENTAVHYFIYHLFFDLMVEEHPYFKQLWNNTVLFYDENEELYENFFNKYDEKLYNEIKSRNPIQKLSYKYEKPQITSKTFENVLLERPQ